MSLGWIGRLLGWIGRRLGWIASNKGEERRRPGRRGRRRPAASRTPASRPCAARGGCERSKGVQRPTLRSKIQCQHRQLLPSIVNFFRCLVLFAWPTDASHTPASRPCAARGRRDVRCDTSARKRDREGEGEGGRESADVHQHPARAMREGHVSVEKVCRDHLCDAHIDVM